MYPTESKRICKVLLAEDNPDDITIVKRVVIKKQDRFQLEAVMDGEDALDFLKKKWPWHNVWTPDLVVLNINMPKVDGLGVLKAMKADPALRLIPVAVWSTSARLEDIREAIEGGCSGMFTKPANRTDAEAQLGAMLEYYWRAWSYPYRDTKAQAFLKRFESKG